MSNIPALNNLIATDRIDALLLTGTNQDHLPAYKCFHTREGELSYGYLEDGIQYQMSLKYFLQLKKFVLKHYNANIKLPINRWYKQLQREDKKEVIIKINKSYSIKA